MNVGDCSHPVLPLLDKIVQNSTQRGLCSCVLSTLTVLSSTVHTGGAECKKINNIVFSILVMFCFAK